MKKREITAKKRTYMYAYINKYIMPFFSLFPFVIFSTKPINNLRKNQKRKNTHTLTPKNPRILEQEAGLVRVLRGVEAESEVRTPRNEASFGGNFAPVGEGDRRSLQHLGGGKEEGVREMG